MATSLLVSAFAVLLAAPAVMPPATSAPRAATPPTTSPTTAPGGPRATTQHRLAAPAPLDWRARLAIAIKALETEAPARLARLDHLQPTRASRDDDLAVPATELTDPRAASVLLRRLLRGDDPVAVRCALVDALPQTGGDWQEGAAALIGIDASPAVRKRLVETMRYADAPHSVHGLRLGFKDEDPEINIAAARTAGFSRSGPELATELYSSTFDADWDLRAAAVQALGMLRLPQSREVLLKALYDDDREVRLQGLLALEQLDPEGVIYLPEIDRLARDRKSHRIARKADLMLQKRRAALKAAKPAVTAAAAPSTGTH